MGDDGDNLINLDDERWIRSGTKLDPEEINAMIECGALDRNTVAVLAGFLLLERVGPDVLLAAARMKPDTGK